MDSDIVVSYSCTAEPCAGVECMELVRWDKCCTYACTSCASSLAPI